MSTQEFKGVFTNQLPVDLYGLFGTTQLLATFTNSNGFWVVYTDGINTYFSTANYNEFDVTQPFSTPVLIDGLEPGITLRAISRDIQSNALAIAYNNDQLIFVDVSDGTYIHKENLFTDLDFSEGAYIQFTIGSQGDYSTALFVTARNPVTKQYYIELYSDDLYTNTDSLFDTVPDIRSAQILGYFPTIKFIYGTNYYQYFQYSSGYPFISYNYPVYLPLDLDTYRSITDGLGSAIYTGMLTETTNNLHINIAGYPYAIPGQTINENTQFIPIGYQTLDGQDVIVYLTDGILYILSITNNLKITDSFYMNTGDVRGLAGLNARITGSNTPGTDFLVGLEYNTLYIIDDTDTPNRLISVYDPIIDSNIYFINFENPNTSLVMNVEALNYNSSPNPMTNETLTDPVFMTGSEGFTWTTVDDSDSIYFPPGKYLYTDIINALNNDLSPSYFSIVDRVMNISSPDDSGTTITFVGGLEGIVGVSTPIYLSNSFTAPYPLANKMSMAIVDINEPNQLIVEPTGQTYPSIYQTLTVTVKGNSLNKQLDGVYNATYIPYLFEFDKKYNFVLNGTAPFGTLSFSYTDPIARNLSLPTRIIITAPLAAMRSAGTPTVSFTVSDTIMDLIKFSNLERRMVRVEQMTMNYSTDVGLNNPIGVQLLCPEFINTYNYDEFQNIDIPIIFSQQYQNPMFYMADTFNSMNGYVLPVTIRTNGLVHFIVKHVLSDGSIVDAPLDNLSVFNFTLCAYVT